jgi:hypothetical protein
MSASSEKLTTGTALRWNAEDGWGVLASPEIGGHVFAHFSMIRDQDVNRLSVAAAAPAMGRGCSPLAFP